MEETTTGVIRLRAMEQDRALRIPVVAVNDAQTKYLFDNRYGTGQSTLDAIIRATGVLVAGSVFVVAGYGWCGRGVASRARGLGADVIVTEVNPIRALEAALDGYQVMRMAEAARSRRHLRHRHRRQGDHRREPHERDEGRRDHLQLGPLRRRNLSPALRKLARRVDRQAEREVETFHLRNGRKLYLLGQGRLVNLAAPGPSRAGDGHQLRHPGDGGGVGRRAQLEVKVHNVPLKIEDEVASMKLAAMGIRIDRLSSEQKQYLAAGRAERNRVSRADASRSRCGRQNASVQPTPASWLAASRGGAPARRRRSIE